jgi:hypothetical protein
MLGDIAPRARIEGMAEEARKREQERTIIEEFLDWTGPGGIPPTKKAKRGGTGWRRLFRLFGRAARPTV